MEAEREEYSWSHADDRRSLPAQAPIAELQLAGALAIHVFGQLLKLFRRSPQSFRGLAPYCWHDLVVEIADYALAFLFQTLGRVAKLLVQLAPKPFEAGFPIRIVL